MSLCESRSPPRARQERGNALILALLALVVTGLAAATALQARHIDAKRASGLAEASVLEALRNAAQAAVYEHLTAIQQGQPFEKSGTVVTPASETGELTWSPTVAQLRDMGYLPSEWSATRSTLNDGPYRITFHRIPAGCLPAACDVQGMVVLGAPVLDVGRTAAVDGVLIGPILTRAGADGGVSLATAPGMISGFHGTWYATNPLPGNPAGVVAMRFGTQTGGFSQFLRVGDLRDPSLRGNLSAEGDLSIGGSVQVSGLSTFIGDSNFQGGIRVGPQLEPCITGTVAGVITVGCAGRINAKAAAFDDDTGNRSLIDPEGAFFSGRVVATGGIRAGLGRIFEPTDPRAIHIEGNELNIQSSEGLLASFQRGNVVVRNSVITKFLSFEDAAEEGASCRVEGALENSSQYGATVDGVLAACIAGRWLSAFRIGQAGQRCQLEGASATDSIDGQSLICRHGIYVRTNALLSSFVLVGTVGLQFSGGPIHVPKPDCPSSGGVAAVPLIVLTPNSEDAPGIPGPTISGINRFAFDVGAEWEVHLEKSVDYSELSGRLIASIYCFFG